ncbi:hypothetical protein X777_14345 [Ooceraea biroi]|uniref:RNA binding protein fox-1-like protein n=1 Tax=Ooceraea biroi TaxID=2015173 RepID=A0A026WUY3_OOCBI|nr:hypothetical protein X777_14345 [Ooceraea biroi]
MCARVACIVTAAALRGVAIQRGRVGAARAAFPTGAAALALARNPTPLAAAAAAATALHPFAPTSGHNQSLKPVTSTAAAAAAAASPLLKTPLSTAQQATYAAAATYTAVAARAYGAAAAAAQPVAGYAAVAGYGREYADPYLGHGIGPVAGYGVRKASIAKPALRFHLTGVPLNRARRSPPDLGVRPDLRGRENRTLRYYTINNGRAGWRSSPRASPHVSLTYELLMTGIFNSRKLCRGES